MDLVKIKSFKVENDDQSSEIVQIAEVGLI